MLGIDHFKAVKNTHGQQAGDQVLMDIAAMNDNCTRREHIVARYGGEAFLIILPDTLEEGARIVAQRIHTSIASMHVLPGKEELRLTISAGSPAVHPDMKATGKDDIIRAADEALYKNKKNGRGHHTVTPLQPVHRNPKP